MKKLLLLSLALCPLICFGITPRKYTGLTLKLCPTATLAAYTPTIPIALEVQLGKQWSLQGEVGYCIPYDKYVDTSFSRSWGIIPSLELRYYFHPIYSTASHSPYFSATVFYKYVQNKAVVYYSSPGGIDGQDNFSVQKNFTGAFISFGWQRTWGNFTFDSFGGIGTVYKHLQNFNREYAPQNGDVRPRLHHPSGPAIEATNSFEENSGYKLHVTAGVRFGWTFVKKKSGIDSN